MYCNVCKYNRGIYKLIRKIFMGKRCRFKCPYPTVGDDYEL